MENTTKKMLVRDVLVVVGFVIFLWVTMFFIMHSILAAVGASHAKNTIIAIGVAALLFATLSLVMLISHLRRNRREIYVEEILHSKVYANDLPHEAIAAAISSPEAEPVKSAHGTFVKVFDIMFIMILCFVTLLAAMLLRGKTVNGADIYSFGIPSALVTVVGFTVYSVNVLRNSNKELKMMIEELYSEEAKAE